MFRLFLCLSFTSTSHLVRGEGVVCQRPYALQALFALCRVFHLTGAGRLTSIVSRLMSVISRLTSVVKIVTTYCHGGSGAVPLWRRDASLHVSGFLPVVCRRQPLGTWRGGRLSASVCPPSHVYPLLCTSFFFLFLDFLMQAAYQLKYWSRLSFSTSGGMAREPSR